MHELYRMDPTQTRGEKNSVKTNGPLNLSAARFCLPERSGRRDYRSLVDQGGLQAFEIVVVFLQRRTV